MSISKGQTTLFNHYKEVERELKDIYHMASVFLTPHSEIIERKKTLHESNHYCRLTSHYKGIIYGMDKILYEKFYENLEWKLIWNGIYYSSYLDLPTEAKEFLKADSKNSLGFFVYRKDNSKKF